MRKLDTIQKRHVLNTIYAADDKGLGGANHIYMIECHAEENISDADISTSLICFRYGSCNEKDSIAGVLDTDLLEIVRDRLIGFQTGDNPSSDRGMALQHIEEALLWLNKLIARETGH